MIVLAGMGTIYKQLTPQERDLIGIYLAEGKGTNEIGRLLKRSASTISREVRRNGPRIRKRDYLPHTAQERAEKRRKAAHRIWRMSDGRILAYVTTKLKEKWSPGLIAGRLSVEHPELRISHETIYRWIYSDGKEYRHLLTRRHRKRKKKGTGKLTRKFNIPERVSINDRPEIVNTRGEAGHWEADTAFFHHCNEVLQVTVERKTRRTILAKMKDPTARSMREAMLKRHRYTPKHLLKSFTYDNGRENVCHVYVNAMLKTKSYFCNPGHSWEKGTVENAIGLIRRSLPKKSNFSLVSEEDLKKIENWLNNRPRKCLAFKTPNEAFRLERCT